MHPLRESINTGIRIDSNVPGFVPEYEEREAARFGLYSWTQWQALNVTERANSVAHFRMNKLITLHQEDAVGTEMERRRKNPKSSNRSR